jgi:hypothetical protein
MNAAIRPLLFYDKKVSDRVSIELIFVWVLQSSSSVEALIDQEGDVRCNISPYSSIATGAQTAGCVAQNPLPDHHFSTLPAPTSDEPPPVSAYCPIH